VFVVMSEDKKVFTKRPWTDEEDDLLGELISDKKNKVKAIAKTLDRTESAVRSRMRTLGLSRPKTKYVVFKGKQFITKGTKDEIAVATGYTVDSITQYIHRTKTEPDKHNVHIHKV